MDEVLSFIEKFSTMKEEFLYEKSYWFAVILRVRFKNSEMYYNINDNHWAVMIDGELYDILGVLDSENFEPWPGKFSEDPDSFRMIIRQSVKFTE